MVTLLFVIFLVLCVVFYLVAENTGSEGIAVVCVVSGIIAFLLLLLVLWSIFGLADGITINRELEMYEEENGRIEQQLETTVSNYMQYEATTFKELKDTDVVSLVSLYPELQSDKLVQSQIDLYINNNQKIKELKEINIMRKEHRESKGKMSPSDKAGLWRKILGGGVTIGGVCLLSHYEAKGNIFSGEKKSFADGFTKVLCRFFGGGD